MTERCSTRGCKKEPTLALKGEPLCQDCWDAYCQDDGEAAAAEPTNQEPSPAAGEANNEETQMTKTKSKSKKQPKPKTPKAPKVAKTRPEKPAKTKRVSALDAAAQVLRKAGKPMSCSDMITAMAEQDLWKSPGGKTPHATLYSAILREVSTKGKDARFKKVDRGQFEYAGGGR